MIKSEVPKMFKVRGWYFEVIESKVPEIFKARRGMNLTTGEHLRVNGGFFTTFPPSHLVGA